MKAVMQDRYGTPDVLKVCVTQRPQIGPYDVLVRVAASPITQGDRRLRSADFPGIGYVPGRLMMGVFKPKNAIPGTVFSGRVVACGAQVEDFEVGDCVWGMCEAGAHSEYLRVNVNGAIAVAPKGFTHADLASVPYGALSALKFIKELAKVGQNDEVVIVGAAGGVGRWAVQIAKHLGARVTAVAHVKDHALLTELGVTRVLDRESGLSEFMHASVDVIFDTTGTLRFQDVRSYLRQSGRFLTLDMSFDIFLQMSLNGVRKGPTAHFGIVESKPEALKCLGTLLAQGALQPHVHRTYALSQIADAHRAFEAEKPRAEIIVEP